MPKPGQQMAPGRKKFVHTVTKYIRDRYPRVLENDDIANALGLTREQVRNSVRNYINREDTHDIIEDGPYRYVATSPNDTPVHPVSGAGMVDLGRVDPSRIRNAAAYGLDGTLLVNGDGPPPTFRYLTTLGAGEVLLQDDVKDVWQARKL